MTTLRQIPSVGWQKLQPVSRKSISGAMQVHEHRAGCIFNSTCFNPKRSGNRSMNALVVADGNVLDCPHCQARGPGPGGSADIIVSLWVLPGAPDTESCADSNPFLPERPSTMLCHNLLFVTVSAVAAKAAFKENCFGPATALIFPFQKK